MQEKLFRKVSLERLSSPEQLDQLMTITNPRGWIGLAGVFCLFLVLVFWSLFGVVTTKIDGQGIMIRGDGVYQLNAIHQGVITELTVSPGDRVQKGDILAYMASSDLLEQIQKLQAKRLKLEKGSIAGNAETIDKEIEALQLSSNQHYAVVSPFNGQVMQMKVAQGSFLTPGERLMDMERSDENGRDLNAVIFLPVHQGKKIRLGMEVELSPESVRREQSGFLLGRVAAVSQYPIAFDELFRLIGDETMAKEISHQQALAEVRVELIPDEGNPGTYQWSSGTSPDYRINSRDLCSAAIVTDHQRPVDLFLPW